MRLSRRAAAQLQNLFSRVEALESEISSKAIYSTYGREAVLVEAQQFGIPAINNNVPGVALAKIVRRFSDDPEDSKQLRTMSTVERVYNATNREVAEGERVMCVRDFFGDLFVVFSGGSDLVRFILTEDLYRCGEATADLIDPDCTTGDEITVVDTTGLAELAFDENAEAYAPEHSMGFARPGLDDGKFEVVSIAIGCCEEVEPPCPQIPGVPMESIPITTDPERLAYALYFDPDGCLVRNPPKECVPTCPPDEEEDVEDVSFESSFESLDESLFEGQEQVVEEAKFKISKLAPQRAMQLQIEVLSKAVAELRKEIAELKK